MIRSSAETLLIKLSSDAEFRLGANVFTNNRLNRIKIEGKLGREHVEIGTKAFYGNSGPFPEIEIVNVHTVIIRSNAFYSKYCTKLQQFVKNF